MSAWRKYMKPIAIGGGVLGGAILLALAVTAGGCQSRLFTKKGTRRLEASTDAQRNASKQKDVNRRELDELLSIE